MKLLTVDIETSPALAYVWGIHEQRIGNHQIVKPTEMLCFAAKWLDKPGIVYRSVHHHGAATMIEELWRLLDEADAVIHYNGTSFDVPHINREFLLSGYGPPSPFTQVDLYRTVRSRFKFLSNKLDDVARRLELGQKAKHEGFSLWVKCLADDPVAWARMRRYNRQDVTLTEALYVELLPWIRSHPSANLIDGLGHACPRCGGKHLVKCGFRHTSVSSFQRYRCGECGGYSQSGQRVAAVDLRVTS